jgi:hypothetical protein
MPLSRITFDPAGGPLEVGIEFPTLQVVAYELILYGSGSNGVTFDVKGNNQNPENDSFRLPTPAGLNEGRLLRFDATFVDPGAVVGAVCRAVAGVRQDGRRLGELVVAGNLTGTSFSGSSFAKLVV